MQCSEKTNSGMSLISEHQEIWKVLENVSVKSPSTIRMEFCIFLSFSCFVIVKKPYVKEFQRISYRFKKTGNVQQQKNPESPKTPAEESTGVETDSNISSSLCFSGKAATNSESRSLNWKIPRKDLKFTRIGRNLPRIYLQSRRLHGMNAECCEWLLIQKESFV